MFLFRKQSQAIERSLERRLLYFETETKWVWNHCTFQLFLKYFSFPTRDGLYYRDFNSASLWVVLSGRGSSRLLVHHVGTASSLKQSMCYRSVVTWSAAGPKLESTKPHQLTSISFLLHSVPLISYDQDCQGRGAIALAYILHLVWE